MSEFATSRQRDASLVMRHPGFKSLTYMRSRTGSNHWAIVLRLADGSYGTVLGETTVEAFESARVALEHEDRKQVMSELARGVDPWPLEGES